MGQRNKKILVVVGGGLFVFGVISGIFLYDSNEQLKELEGKIKPHTTINGVDVSLKRYSDIEREIEERVQQMKESSISLKVGTFTSSKTLEELGFRVNIGASDLIQQVEQEQWPDSYIEKVVGLYQENTYAYQIEFSWEQEKLKEWVKSIAAELNRPLIMPEIRLDKKGFILTEGQDAYELDQEALVKRLDHLLLEATKGIENLSLSTELVQVESRATLYEQLKTIDHKISSFQSYYPIADVDRSFNLELATQKLDGTVILPGEVFSFTEKVAPVTLEAGYRPSTVFINGKPSIDVGGGVCQVSSTLYNTQLQAGILPTERRNHSLRVYYVPIGQDATMYEGSIDYKFENTLDYPIYIEATAKKGVLEISFWSNEAALNGIRYEPKTIISSNGLRADTTLYGYDEEGNLVYQKFLHTSHYKG